MARRPGRSRNRAWQPRTTVRTASHWAVGQLTFQAVPFHRSIRVLAAPTSPTAQALVREVAATLKRAAPPAGLGLGTLVHPVPFHRAIRVVMTSPGPLPLSVPPTAQALLADVAATPMSMPPGAPRPGLGTCFHAVPSHRSIKGPLNPLAVAQLVQPTAQALMAESAATTRRTSGLGASGLGLGTCAHAVPFHRRISVLELAPPVLPTAQALPAETAATPDRTAPPAGVGLGTCFHAVPFHRSIRVLPAPVWPTAQALVADVAATLDRTLPAGAGLATCFQLVPFHRTIRG